MNRREIMEKITQKKEFSELPRKDVEIAFSHFEKRQASDEEKVKLTRNLLREVFSAFTSKKLLSLKEKNPEWILKKHLSTRERFDFYPQIYGRTLKGLGKDISVIDLGAGVNGFSYNFFSEDGFNVKYAGVEAIGQLVKLTNSYFKKEKIKGKIVHSSLFDLKNLNSIIEKTVRPRAIFLFKVTDSLEMLEKDFSKKLITKISPLAERIIVSFATESMVKRTRFKVKRSWFTYFLEKNFSILDDFEIGKERYIVFKK